LRVGDTLPSGGTHLSPAANGLGGGYAVRTVAGQRLPEISNLSVDPFLLSFKPVDRGGNNVVCDLLFSHISFAGHWDYLFPTPYSNALTYAATQRWDERPDGRYPPSSLAWADEDAAE
jgi:hypothetical protein